MIDYFFSYFKVKPMGKYKRNSGLKKKSKSKALAKVNKITNQEINTAANQLLEDAKWLSELENMNQFSSEWVHKVAVELLFQCMGKKEIVVNYGNEPKLIRVFKEKAAQAALDMIAKMNGHLFDTVKGTIKQTGTIEHDHQHTIEMKPDANRTIEVFNILEECGALKPEAKQIDIA